MAILSISTFHEQAFDIIYVSPPPLWMPFTMWLSTIWCTFTSTAGAALSPQNGFGLFLDFQTIFHLQQPTPSFTPQFTPSALA